MKNKFILLISILMVTGFLSCRQKNNVQNSGEKKVFINEEFSYRPNFHFTPKTSWINDPNGMFYHEGIYHLFFQHYPDDIVWGPMHWGHATSRDLIKWEQQPIALYPDDKGYIFSGSAVVDTLNTSGLGSIEKPPILALFTYHDPEGELLDAIDHQTQGLAFSTDSGNSWQKYGGNPVLKNPGIRDFRDPKVIWSKDHEKWIMVLSAFDRVRLYDSKNLIDWNFLSEFGNGVGAHGGIWECPDIFPIEVNESNEIKWVLLLSINDGAANGGSGTQYFVGDFDGKSFVLDELFQQQLKENGPFWLDYGKDNYAGVTWSNIPTEDGRRIFIGWMSNWQYAEKVPTKKWRNSMTLPRELKLVRKNDSYSVISKPVTEFDKYKNLVDSYEGISLKNKWSANTSSHIGAEIEVEFEVMDGDKLNILLYNQEGDTLSFGYDDMDNTFFLDRRKLLQKNFSDDYAASKSVAPRKIKGKNLSAKIVLDKTSVEIFYDDGHTVFTEILFPKEALSKISIASKTKGSKIESLRMFEIATEE